MRKNRTDFVQAKKKIPYICTPKTFKSRFKMKCLLITLCVFLVTASVRATEVGIKFEKTCDGYENGRSLSLQPYTIHLYSDDFPIETMQATVKDGMGNILSWETITLNPEQPYTFTGDISK